jgi:hypothetical protein
MKRQFGDLRVPGSRTIMAGISASPWGWLIMLVILFIVGFLVWGFLNTYHLVTAFVFFIGGLILAWFSLNLIPKYDRGEHAFKLVLIPVILGIVGYFLEFLNIWRVPYSVEFSLFGLIAEPVTITLDSILLMVIAVLILVQIVLSLKER